jgi:hypothetical protein
MDHAAAFRDSLEERALYMKGIQVSYDPPLPTDARSSSNTPS